MTMPYQPPHPGTALATEDERTYGMLCHLASFAGYIIPFGNVAGPLIVWQMKKEGSPFVDEHGKEALNFQISVTLYAIVAGISILLLVGLVLLPAVVIFGLVFTIIAAIKAKEGEPYRYPFTLRLL